LRLAPSKRTFLEAAFLEALAAAAGTQIIAAELFFEQFVFHDADTAFYVLLGRESFPSLAHPFKKNGWLSKSCLNMGHLLRKLLT
jgi:hypothetical protein